MPDRPSHSPHVLQRVPSGRTGRLLLGAPLALLLAGLVGASGLLVTRPAQPATPSPVPAIGDTTVNATPPAEVGRPTPATAEPSPTASPAPGPSPTPERPTSLPPNQLTGFVWPLRNARLTSGFGQRDDGLVLVDGERLHAAIDLTTWCGDKIRAAHAGTVLYAGRKFDEHLGYSDSLDAFYARLGTRGIGQLPIVVVIDYGNGYRGLYAHLSRAAVEAGDVVDAGQIIGIEGATGRATGCHLHYSLIRMDGAWMAITPELVERYNYPPLTRERIDPLRVLPLRDGHAPQRFRQRYQPQPRPAGSGPLN